MPDGSMSEFNTHPQYEGAIGRGKQSIDINQPNFDINANSGNGAEKKDPLLEAALANNLVGRNETLNDALISSAETPQELFRGMRRIFPKLEDGDIPDSLSKSYEPPAQHSILFTREQDLKTPISKLIEWGWLDPQSYDETTGLGMPTHRKYSAAALVVDEVYIKDDKGNYVPDIFGRPSTRIVFKYGTEDQRAEMGKAYERARHEMEVRSIMGVHIGARRHIKLRDNLEGLVDWQHGAPKFNSTHLKALWNMPDVDEMAENPENRSLGDRIEEATFLYLVMLHSGSKQKMQELLARPGAQYLISKLHKEEQARRGDETYARVDWIEEYIGKVNAWIDDDKRDLTETWKDEAKKEFRGKLTKWGNICAFGGNPGDFGGDDEKAFIEETIGGAVGSVEASWLAATNLRVIGAFGTEGYVALPNGKTLLTLGEARYLSSDDEGKLTGFPFTMKEGLKGNPSGLKGMVGRMPNLAFNLYDWAQVKVVLPDGTTVRRSIWDAWLGTAKQEKRRLKTGERIKGSEVKEEGYHRLGDLNYDSLDRDFHTTYAVMKWLIARDKDGVFTNALRTEVEYSDFFLEKLKKMQKYLKICFNPIVLSKGSTHLYEMGEKTPQRVETYDLSGESSYKISFLTFETKDTETIQRNFFDNLMTARVNSAAFTAGVLPQTVREYSFSKGANVEIPAVIKVKKYINEARRPMPKNMGEVLLHYLDDPMRNLVDPDAEKQPNENDRIMSFYKSLKYYKDTGLVLGINSI